MQNYSLGKHVTSTDSVYTLLGTSFRRITDSYFLRLKCVTDTVYALPLCLSVFSTVKTDLHINGGVSV